MPQVHPTILIGYGEYGEGVLRRLLINASNRGVLQWEESTTGEPRRVKGLAFLHVRDLLDSSLRSHTYTDADHGFEMMEDLFDQIEEVGPPEAPVITDRIDHVVKRLLSSSSTSMAGLDVIILASPPHADSLGRLMTLFQPGLRKQAEDRMLAAPKGQELLNCMLVLDFENYWENSPERNKLRQGLASLVQQSEQGRTPQDFGFGRVFLFDSRVSGYRDIRTRLEEAVLFLEFLFFEEQRHNEQLRTLFRRHPSERSPLCAVGIRVVEHNVGLLFRLAAAAFGTGWLKYLRKNASSEGRQHSLLREELQDFFPERLPQALGADAFEQWVEDELTRIEVSLFAGYEARDWPRRVQSELERHRFELKTKAAAEVRDRIRRALGAKLQDLSGRLDEAVTRSLSERGAGPQTLGALLGEVKQLETELASTVTYERQPEGSTANSEDLAEAHRDFSWLSQGQLQKVRFSKWWWLFAAACGLAYAPIIIEALGEVSPPDPAASAFAQHVYRSIHWLSGQTLIVAAVATVSIGLIGYYSFHRSIGLRVGSARDFFIDPKRGRLISKLRAYLRSDAFRGDLEDHIDRVRQDLLAASLMRVRKDIKRIRDLLEKRIGEIEWLQGQMEKYLIPYGVEIKEDKTPVFRQRPSLRFHSSTETSADFQAIAQRVSRDDGFYQSYQTSRRWFDGWSQVFCDAFLHPLAFLELVSKQFGSADLQNRTDGDPRWSHELADFLQRESGFRPGFNWLAQEVTATQAFCVLPSGWLNASGSRSDLSDHAFQHPIESKSADRAYFLKLQVGVLPKDLNRSDL